ncbi:hypothetical protein [Herbiconiux ginsengi]|uniref:Uncharacterized protein n=1 Tax=Herbiconiux ginsengi TaxID=381665 RepID=A0A1H3U2E0_9MICO|nr:hypothetical protein [Herbiconiux ginsengi]SDZ56630.1 hypothetical protein SAMN05216554_0063 [Herbiconiux ginsengi]
MSTEFQLVPVPTQHVVAVMRFIAEIDSTLQTSEEVSSSISTWSDEALERFAHGESKTLRIVQDVIDVLVKTPGVWFNLDELAEATTWDRATLKGVWTHLSRALKAHFDGNDWPLAAIWGLHLEPQLDPAMYYRVTEDQAAQWLRVR